MKRLLDDPMLGSELRAELQRSRRAGEDYDVLAKLPQLRAALGTAPLTATEPANRDGRGAGADSAATGTRLAHEAARWKLTLLSAAFGVGSAVVWVMTAQPHEPPPARSPSAATAAAPSQAAAPRVAGAAPEPAEPAARSAPSIATPEAEAARAESTSEPVSRVPDPTADSGQSTTTSRREIAQLVRIRALLERDPDAAYRLAQRSDREFPRGVLNEERLALSVLALAKSGESVAAAQKARQFFQRYPQSPLREQVTAALRR